MNQVKHATALAADLIELRFDQLQNYSRTIRELGKIDTPPLIATYRSNQAKRNVDLLLEAVNAGFEYVDLDARTEDVTNKVDLLRQHDAKIILSNHNYSTTPNLEQVQSTIEQLHSNKPDICKVVTTARSLADNLTILQALDKNHERIPLVCFAMGRMGTWSRILAPFHGARFTYASLKKGLETALGQPSITGLREIYKILDD
jgi:3-dehydroquinate dehydratase type I